MIYTAQLRFQKEGKSQSAARVKATASCKHTYIDLAAGKMN